MLGDYSKRGTITTYNITHIFNELLCKNKQKPLLISLKCNCLNTFIFNNLYLHINYKAIEV